MISVNGYEVKPTKFPDGTSQVWKLPEEIVRLEQHLVKWNFESEAELIHLAQLRALLGKKCSLRIPYLPYARQDKEISNDTTFSLIPFAHFLNYIGFSEVVTWDMHSIRPSYLINNLHNILPTIFLEEILRDYGNMTMVFPDHGAFVRYGYEKKNYCVFKKKREQYTGKIVGLEFDESYGPLAFETERFLIVDDICDGGATFEEVAKKLRELNPKCTIYLYVTHGIFSKGIKPLIMFGGISKIFTTDSLKQKEPELLERLFHV